MATKKPMKKPVKRVRRFQEGGEAALEAALKAEGLAASNRDAPKGFFESLRRFGQGNIDQAGSEAYNLYGAGRGRMERAAASEFPSSAGNGATTRALAPVSAEGRQTYADIAEREDADMGLAMRANEMLARGAAEGDKDYKKYTGPIAKPAAAAQVAALLAAKPAKRVPATANKVRIADAQGAREADEEMYQRAAREGARSTRAASAAAAPRNDASAIPKSTNPAGVADGERLPEVTGMSNLEKLIAGTGIAGGALGIATKGKKIYEAGKKALQGFRSAKDAAKKSSPSGVTGVMPSKNIYTGAKKGGMVKKMAHGGSVKSAVSTASKRADGIAQRGKTRGKIY